MATSELVSKLENLIEPMAEQHGFELVAIEMAGGRHTPVVRIMLDREDGIDIEALTSANRWISDVLEEKDPIPGHYTLEVSSPGVDRPLRKLADFDRFSGETVQFKTRGIPGRSNWKGTLVRTEGESIVVDVDGEEHTFALKDIEKARLKGVIDFGKGGTT